MLLEVPPEQLYDVQRDARQRRVIAPRFPFGQVLHKQATHSVVANSVSVDELFGSKPGLSHNLAQLLRLIRQEANTFQVAPSRCQAAVALTKSHQNLASGAKICGSEVVQSASSCHRHSV